MSSTIDLVKEGIANGMLYTEYRQMVSELLLKGQSTGHEQTEDLLNYTMLNNQRMKRLDKTIRISEEVKKLISKSSRNLTFLTITEGWCGDASQVMPVINKIVDLNSNFEMRVVLRDDNPELMGEFLTNGNKAIAKFIIFDRETETVVGTYGPRPTIPTQMVLDYKEKHGSLNAEFKENLQVWYNKNKGKNVIADVMQLLQTLEFSFEIGK